MPRTIEITIAPDGTTTVEAVGFAGAECRQATRAFEDALGRMGAALVSDVAKPELAQAARTTAANRQQLGQGG